MMDILMSETCWAHKKWNKIESDIKLVFHSSTMYRILFGSLQMTAVTVFLSGSPCVSVHLFVTNDWDPIDGFSVYLMLGSFTRISYRIPVCLKFCSSIIFSNRTKNIERKLCNTYKASVLCSVYFYASFLIFSGTMKQKKYVDALSKFPNRLHRAKLSSLALLSFIQLYLCQRIR